VAESWASSSATRKSMQGNKRRDTAPELRLRSALHRAGLRYRVDVRPIPDLNRRADVVFRPTRVAVFVHGCFWHGCPEHHTIATRNAEYWAEKVEKNRARDENTRQALESAGWLPIVVWEHEDSRLAAERVIQHVRQRRKP
jgi:DNA mismatch endonuclease (patch repair protein)